MGMLSYFNSKWRPLEWVQFRSFSSYIVGLGEKFYFYFFFSDKWYNLFHNAQAGNNLLKEIAVLVGMSPFSEIILGLQPRDKRVMFHIPESKIIVSKTNHR